jgi:hypothetical protein
MLLNADQYDAQGKLWRVMEATIYPAVELGACVSQEFMSYDLNVNRYMAENATQEAKPTDWLAGDEGRIDAQALQFRRTAPCRRALIRAHHIRGG